MQTNLVQNKTILITGASNGIGFETALNLAAMGAKIVIAGRDEKRTSLAAKNIIAQTGNENISYLLADLSSSMGVRQLVKSFNEKHHQLDILINNAGAMTSSRELSADGYEMCWGLNHLNYFLLTNELLPLLKASGQEGKKSRIINVASMAHKKAKIDFDDLQGEKSYAKWKAYGQSKLANIMFTYALARRLEGSNVTANCLHPGVVATGFIVNIGIFEKLLTPIIKMFLISSLRGAQTSIYLASSKDVENINGKYFDKSNPISSSDYSYDEDIQERLWNLSLEQVE
jgi:NAD(P)-dependent dehydrogenase (short-subunit alcohol dehydrogenase family)